MSVLTNVTDFARNARIVRNAIEYSTIIPDFFHSGHAAGPSPAMFDSVHTYVMFIGIGRSGTTLIGSLMDAHPHMLIANQQTTLKYLRLRFFSRARIFSLLVRNSRDAARTGRPGGGGYSYAVAGQWQGTFETLEVIGDKSKSAQAVTWLTSRPALLDALLQVTGSRVRMMHVIRNPFDTIATRSVRRGLSLERISREYFGLTARLRELIARIDAMPAQSVARIPVFFEDFIAQPAAQLAAVCDRVGVQATDEYLRACAGIVRQQPHRSRHEVAWNPRLVAQIQRNLDEIPFLRRYTFDD